MIVILLYGFYRSFGYTRIGSVKMAFKAYRKDAERSYSGDHHAWHVIKRCNYDASSSSSDFEGITDFEV